MKPIPLFLKKNSHPPIRAIFEKSAPPFYEGGEGGGGGSGYVLCLSNISSEDHKQRKTFCT